MSKKTKISLSRLESFLKAQCDRLRTSMDAAEYKNYIIALLFLKRINDQFEIDRLALKDDLKKQYPDADEATIEEELDIPSKYNCYVPVLARWKYLLHPMNEEGELLMAGPSSPGRPSPRHWPKWRKTIRRYCRGC